jgi:hypothetical protein
MKSAQPTEKEEKKNGVAAVYLSPPLAVTLPSVPASVQHLFFTVQPPHLSINSPPTPRPTHPSGTDLPANTPGGFCYSQTDPLPLLMERKQGFFAVLREELVRGLSPARARRKLEAARLAAALRYARGARGGEVLAPLMEGPDSESGDGGGGGRRGGRARKEGWGQWVRGHLARTPPSAAGVALLLGVMGVPLGPVHVCAAEPLPDLSFNDTHLVSPSVRDSIVLLSIMVFVRWSSHLLASDLIQSRCLMKNILMMALIYPRFL